ncbi:MAG: DNA-protecting protein DprA [Nitrospirae bacterium]|nr:DNA-protecting protein DprA [Nitrospirota bacterium]
MNETRYWLGLSQVPDIGPALSKRLLAVFGSPENIFEADAKDLSSVRGISPERVESIMGFGLWNAVDRQIAECAKKNIRIVHYNGPAYPEVLNEVDGAPVVFFMKGDYAPGDRYSIAVVGSRKNTAYGEVVTNRIAGELASAGFTIVSGLARGIDTLAHKSALSNHGRTIAVLGSGLDVFYPAENKGLLGKIAESGCALSEFLPGTLPNKENFPRRNRLISGLSMGVLVVEAAESSGSLITARFAVEQNKEVFAVPGNITSLNSEGTNSLIKQGAKLVLETRDVIEELAPVLKGFIKAENRLKAALSEDENRVCSNLSREPKHVDSLSREVKIPVHKMLELLLSLELKGVVRQSGGKRFYLS